MLEALSQVKLARILFLILALVALPSELLAYSPTTPIDLSLVPNNPTAVVGASQPYGASINSSNATGTISFDFGDNTTVVTKTLGVTPVSINVSHRYAVTGSFNLVVTYTPNSAASQYYQSTVATTTVTVSQQLANLFLNFAPDGTYGTPYTLSADLQGPASTSPSTGTITFTVDGAFSIMGAVSTDPSSGDGVATCILPAALSAGNHTVALAYSGSTDNTWPPCNGFGAFTIDPLTTSIQVSNTTQTYTGQPLSVSATCSTNGVVPANILVLYSVGGAATTTAPTTAGAYPFTASINDPNYSAAPVNGVLTISPVTVNVTYSNTTTTYNGSAQAVGVTPTPTVPITLTYSQGGTALTGPPVNAGVYTVQAQPNDSVDYAIPPSQASTSMAILQASQTISFQPLSSAKFGQAPVSLTASASSGLGVNFTCASSPDAAVATINGTSLLLPATGSTNETIIVTAAQPGNGNYSPAPSVTQTFVLLENTAPTSVAQTTTAPNNAGWFSGPVTVNVSATDNNGGSGVKLIAYSIDGGPQVVINANTGSFQLSGDGQHNVRWFSADNAGNVEATHTLPVNIDSTAPTVSATPSRPPDTANGWYTSPVTITFSGNDNVSGLNQSSLTPPITYSGGDSATASVVGSVSDNAGNKSSTTFFFKYDATPPAISVAGVENGGAYQVANFDVSANDSGSGGNLTLTVTVKLNGQQIMSNAFTGPVPDSGPLSYGLPNGSQDGIYELDLSCMDDAGHQALLNYSFTVANQKAAISFVPPSPADQSYTNSGQSIVFVVNDPLSLFSSSATLTSSTATGDSGPNAFTSGFQVAAEGKYYAHISATDTAGNVSNSSLTFWIDRTPPILEPVQLSGTAGKTFPWYASPVTVTLSASDPLLRPASQSHGAIAGSGVTKILYFSTGAQATGSQQNPVALSGPSGSFLIAAEGKTTIFFWAVDGAGNSSSPQSFTVSIDLTPPTLQTIADISVIADGPSGSIVTFPNPVVKDNVSIPSIVFSPASGSTFSVGTTPVVCTVTDEAGNSVTGSFKVNVANPIPILTAISPQTATAIGSAFTLTVSGANFMPTSQIDVGGTAYVSNFVNSSQVSLALPANAISVSGQIPVNVVTPGPGGGTSSALNLSVVPATQTITFKGIVNHVYGDPPFPLLATSTSGLPVSFRVIAGSAIVVGNSLTITGAGNVTISAEQSGNSAFSAASPVVQTFSVAKYKPNLTLTGGTYAYDGTVHAATATLSGVADVPLTGSLSYSPSTTQPVNSGTYIATYSYSGSADYEAVTKTASVVINPVAPTITLTGGTFAFDGSAHYASGAVTGLNNTLLPARIDYSPGIPINVGSYKATLSYSGSVNYTAQTKSVEIRIVSVDPVLSITGGTWNYDGKAHYAVASVTDSYGHLLNGTVSYSPYLPVNAGTYTATLSFAGSNNFLPSSKSATLTILPIAPTLTLSDSAVTYDALPHNSHGTVKGLNGISLTGTMSYSPGGTPINAGVYTATLTYAGSINYTSASVSAKLTILQAVPNISLTGGTFTYDAQAHPAQGAVIGVDNNPLPAKFTYDPGPYPPYNSGTYTARLSFAGNENYQAVSTSAHITINPAQPTVNLVSKAIYYDGKTHSLDGSVVGVDGTILDSVFSYAPGGAALPGDVGTYSVTLSFVGSQNYGAASKTATLKILPVLPNLSLTAGTFTYDGTPHAAQASVTGVDGSALNFSLSYIPGGSVVPVEGGTYGVLLQFPGSKNYLPTYKSAVLTITKSVPVLTATGGNYDYDATVHPVSIQLNGLNAPPSSYHVLYSPGGEIPPINAGTYTATVNYLGSKDYKAATTSATVVISPIPATYNLSDRSMDYDANPHFANGSVTGLNGLLLPGVITYSSKTYAPIDAGSYIAVLTFAGNNNYLPGSKASILTINPVAPTLNLTGGTFTYDGLPHFAKGSVIGLGGAVLPGTISYSPGNYAATNAGSYAVTLNFAGSKNYLPASMSATLNIQQATPVLTITGGQYPEDGSPHAASGSVKGVRGETLIGTMSYTPGGASAPSATGDYVATLTFPGSTNYISGTKSAPISIGAAAKLASLSFISPRVAGGETTYNFMGTVFLNQVTYMPLALQLSASGGASVPNLVTVNKGSDHVSFVIATPGVDQPTLSTVSATSGGVTVSSTFTILPASIVEALCLTDHVTGGNTAKIGFILDGVSGPHGTTVEIFSSDPSVPNQSFSIMAGVRGGWFDLVTKKVISQTPVQVFAFANGGYGSLNLTVMPSSARH